MRTRGRGEHDEAVFFAGRLFVNGARHPRAARPALAFDHDVTAVPGGARDVGSQLARRGRVAVQRSAGFEPGRLFGHVGPVDPEDGSTDDDLRADADVAVHQPGAALEDAVLGVEILDLDALRTRKQEHVPAGNRGIRQNEAGLWRGPDDRRAAQRTRQAIVRTVHDAKLQPLVRRHPRTGLDRRRFRRRQGAREGHHRPDGIGVALVISITQRLQGPSIF